MTHIYDDTAVDVDLLLKIANYEGVGSFSDPARKALDAIAERMRALAELNLKIAQARRAQIDIEKAAHNRDETIYRDEPESPKP